MNETLIYFNIYFYLFILRVNLNVKVCTHPNILVNFSVGQTYIDPNCHICVCMESKKFSCTRSADCFILHCDKYSYIDEKICCEKQNCKKIFRSNVNFI